MQNESNKVNWGRLASDLDDIPIRSREPQQQVFLGWTATRKERWTWKPTRWVPIVVERNTVPPGHRGEEQREDPTWTSVKSCPQLWELPSIFKNPVDYKTKRLTPKLIASCQQNWLKSKQLKLRIPNYFNSCKWILVSMTFPWLLISAALAKMPNWPLPFQASFVSTRKFKKSVCLLPKLSIASTSSPFKIYCSYLLITVQSSDRSTCSWLTQYPHSHDAQPQHSVNKRQDHFLYCDL